MQASRYCTIFAITLLCIGQTFNLDFSCGNWLPFKDEKCFVIIDDKTRTFADAERACAALDDNPSLVVIQSKEEQDFLSNYLFNISKKVENFWIGAKVVNNKAQWNDNTRFDFTNWDKRGPRNKADYCVEMQADESFVGLWIDEPCIKKNLVVCQRIQTWSAVKLQKAFLDIQKELKELKQGLIPIGFIYSQIPNAKAPSDIWPSFTWTDVSDSYAGVFFRVNGGAAEPFGSTQTDNAPRITQVQRNYNNVSAFSVTLNVGSVSDWLYTGDSIKADYAQTAHMQFTTSGGEVRPRNMAIRVWKRTG